jgi:hypothetical protein
MKFDLTCGTDAANFAIYDPGAVLHVINAKDPDEAGEAFEDEARKGNLIAYTYGGDGEASFHVIVDEPLPPELMTPRDKPVRGVLRVPTGRLVASGAEYVFNTARKQVTADEFHPKQGSEQRIPAGNYAVTAIDRELPGVEAAVAADDAARKAHPIRWAVARIADRILRFVLIAAVLLFFLILGMVVTGKLTIRDVVPTFRQVGPWTFALLLVLLALKRLAPARAPAGAAEVEDSDLPGVVVHLERLPDDEDISTRPGCLFGDGEG